MADETWDFPTEMVATAVMMGNGTDGAVQFTFFTPAGTPHLRTVLRPEVTAELASDLMLAVSNIPNLNQAMGLASPRKRPPKKPGEVQFGQSYPPEILQTLGLLMVRVNLLERSLVKLLSEVGGLSAAQAEGLFFSTQNMKARLDMIRVLSGVSDITEWPAAQVEKALQKAKAVAHRRNDLVHGHWTLNNDNFEVETIQPQNRNKRVGQTVTQKSLEILAGDYRVAGLLAEGAADTVRMARDMARNTEATNPTSPEGTL
jgi:hypothetical protein